MILVQDDFLNFYLDKLFPQRGGLDSMWRVGEPDQYDDYVLMTSDGLYGSTSNSGNYYFVCKGE